MCCYVFETCSLCIVVAWSLRKYFGPSNHVVSHGGAVWRSSGPSLTLDQAFRNSTVNSGLEGYTNNLIPALILCPM